MSDEVKLMQLESQLRSIQSQLSSFVKKKKIVAGTGIVVTYDGDGMIVGSRNLQATDIPELPVSKINGLEEFLTSKESSAPTTPTSTIPDDLESRLESLTTLMNETMEEVSNFASEGAVVRFSQIDGQLNQLRLELQDLRTEVSKIPRAVTIPNYSAEIANVNSTVQQLMGTVMQQSREIQALKIQLAEKATKTSVTPGTYTKVTVTREGTISGWQPLTEGDLPQLDIQDIKDLQIQLNRKATNEFVVNLANTVATLMDQVSKITPTDQLEQALRTKASDADLQDLINRIQSVANTLTNYQKSTDKKITNLAAAAVIHDPKKLFQ